MNTKTNKYSFNDIVVFARTGLNPRDNFKLGLGNNNYITIKNIQNNTLIIDKNTDLIDDDALKLIHKRSQIKKGDILFASIGRMGDMYIIPEEPTGWDINESVFAFTLNTNIITQKYFYYIFKNQATIDYLQKNSSGSTFKSIKMNQLKKMHFQLPAIEEQKQISNILDKVTKIIVENKKLLEKYDVLIKSRFIEMFGDEPVENGKWKVEKLGEHLINIENGKSFVCSNEKRRGENPAILKLSAVTYGAYNDDENKVILSEEDFVKNAEVRNGDLLFTRKNTPELVGMAAYVFETGKNLMMPDLIFRLNPRPTINKIYLWQLINHPIFRDYVKLLASGSAKSMSNISKERLNSLKIPVPPLELQQQFASFVQQIDKSKFVVQKSLEKAETLYKSLMQEYFG